MPLPELLTKKILIVDDESVNIMVLEQMLQESGYKNVCGLTDPVAALANFEAHAPDLIVLDLRMPIIDGFQVMEQVRARTPEGVYLPILILTADANQEVRRRALAAGATDFLTKPFDEIEVLLRIENLLRTRWQHLLLQNQNAVLDRKVYERTQALDSSHQKLELAQMEIIQRLAIAAEYRDDDTGQHTKRVGKNSYLLARQLGLSASHCDLIGSATPLHDVGKIGIPDTILLKPGRLTEAEFGIMQGHTTIGASMLGQGHSPLVQLAEIIALTHHERWNGSGYPHGLKGDSIPIEGQITAIVDVFDALPHGRPYKQAWPIKEALTEIESNSGSQFAPEVVKMFLTLDHQALI